MSIITALPPSLGSWKSLTSDQLLPKLAEQMSEEAAKITSTTHHHFAGPWLDLVWRLIQIHPDTLKYDMF